MSCKPPIRAASAKRSYAHAEHIAISMTIFFLQPSKNNPDYST
jgi:hypothetical protein